MRSGGVALVSTNCALVRVSLGKGSRLWGCHSKALEPCLGIAGFNAPLFSLCLHFYVLNHLSKLCCCLESWFAMLTIVMMSSMNWLLLFVAFVHR